MKKRIVSAVLTAMLVFGIFAINGCNGKNSDNKEVTLVWAIADIKQKDSDLVMVEVNKMLSELLPGTKLEMIQDSSLGTKWSLWMAGKTQIDIAHAGFDTNLQDEISKQSYYKMNDLINQYAPTIKEEWEKYGPLYMTGTVGGDLYAIPNIQVHINNWRCISVPSDLKDYIDADAILKAATENTTTTEEFYIAMDQYLEKVFAAKANNDRLIDINNLYKCIVKLRGFEAIGSNESNYVYRASDDNVKVMDLYDTPEFALFMKYARRWFEKGYVPKDIISQQGGYTGDQSVLVARGYNALTEDPDRTGKSIVKSGEFEELKISITPDSQLFSGSNVVGSLMTYNAIPITAKHPERAMQLLELLRTEKGRPLLNLLVYGIEGKHYEKLSDTEIKAFDYEGQGSSKSAYGLRNWVMGTHLNMYVVRHYTELTREAGKKYYDEIMPGIRKTPVYGMTVDVSRIENELAQIKGVCGEFELQLISGAFENYETIHKNMKNKLKSAGEDKVITELQKQVDKYIADNK